MSKWKTYRLGDIIQLKSGGTPDKSNPDYWGGSIPWISAKSMYDDFISTSDLFITEEGLQAGSKIAKKDSILLLTRGSGLFNRIPVCYVVSDVAYNQDVKNIVLKQEDVTSIKFLYYWLYGNKELLSSMLETTGIGAGKIDTKRFLNLSISLPSQKEQARYIHLMDLLFDKIELNRRINANLEAQAQALFRSWFVDFEPFRDGPFVDYKKGKIPQGWKVGNYTDIVEIKGGGTPKTGIQEYWDGTIPFFSPKDVGASCFVLDTEKHITAKGLENCNSSLFQTNTVFITARGTVGKVVMTGTEMAMNQTNYALLGKQNISQYYVYHITRQLVTRLLKKANGAVFNAITTRDFTSEQIVMPPFSTIRQFSDVVKPIYENILLNDVQSNRLSALRDTLLPKLMSGAINLH